MLSHRERSTYVQDAQTTYFIVVSWVEVAMLSVLVAAVGVATTLWV
jgi:hypothetical protein